MMVLVWWLSLSALAAAGILAAAWCLPGSPRPARDLRWLVVGFLAVVAALTVGACRLGQRRRLPRPAILEPGWRVRPVTDAGHGIVWERARP